MNPYADPDISPLAVAKRLDAETDREWRGWDPVALREHCKLHEDDVQQLDKLMATQVACTNQDAFLDWPLFTHVCTAFNGRRCNFGYLDKPSATEAAWTCVCLRALAPYQFGPGVMKYLTAICVDEGILYFPWTVNKGLDGFEPAQAPWAHGLMDPNVEVVATVKRAIEHGALEAAIGEIDESDKVQAQMAKLTAIQKYIDAAEAKKGDA